MYDTMFDSYDNFVYAMSDLIVKAKNISDEEYMAWRQNCFTRMESMKNPEFMKALIEVIDKHSGKCEILNK